MELTDYVVTRKRKRYAVDPCLGYYLYAPLNDAGGPGESTAGVCSNLANERIAHAGTGSGLGLECTEVPQLMKRSSEYGDKIMRGSANRSSEGRRSRWAQSQEEDVPTVEAFLNNSTKGRITKTYRYRKRQNDRKSNAGTEKSIRSSGRMDSTLPRSFASNDGEENSASCRRGYSKNTRRRKNRRPLKERLYEAAILSHGNPDEYYTRSDAAENMASNRVALLFVPEEHTSRDRLPAAKAHTKALLVDPRKSMAMQTASLTCHPHRGYTESGRFSNALDRIPLSKWNLSLNDGEHPKWAQGVSTKRKKGKTTGDMAFTTCDYPPLTFVSFQEAEKQYKAMFPGAGTGLFQKPDTLATNIASSFSVEPAPEGATDKRDAHDCSSQSERTSSAVPGSLPGIPAIRTRVHLTTATSQQASLSSANSTSNVGVDGALPGHPLPGIVLPNFISAELSASFRAEERMSRICSDASPSLEGPLCSPISDNHNDMVNNEKTRYKTLRPLRSFVNELLAVKRNSKL